MNNKSSVNHRPGRDGEALIESGHRRPLSGTKLPSNCLLTRRARERQHKKKHWTMYVFLSFRLEPPGRARRWKETKAAVPRGKNARVASVREHGSSSYPFVHGRALVQGQHVARLGTLFVMEHGFQPVEHLAVPATKTKHAEYRRRIAFHRATPARIVCKQTVSNNDDKNKTRLTTT